MPERSLGRGFLRNFLSKDVSRKLRWWGGGSCTGKCVRNGRAACGRAADMSSFLCIVRIFELRIPVLSDKRKGRGE